MNKFIPVKFIPLVLMVLIFILVLSLASWPKDHARALPEYSAQVGEPCATCHISPSGGGSRTPRGQAWVGSDKPGAVPDLLAALELLGVHLDVDESQFTTVPEEIPPAQPLQLDAGQLQAVHERLRDYDGN